MKNNKILLLFIVSSLLVISGCSDTSLLNSIKKISEDTNKSNDKTVRGPTGGSTGGGIIAVEKDGKKIIDKNYYVYIEINGSKKMIKSGKTSSSGTIELSEEELSLENFEKIKSNQAKLIVEAEIDGVKTVVNSNLNKDEA